MPDLDYLYNKFKDQGFVILAISDEKEETVKEFTITKKNNATPIRSYSIQRGERSTGTYLIGEHPESFIL